MGVFARIFRRSKATEETRAAEPKESAGAPESTGPAEHRAKEVPGTDTVEIPKQQSAEAADSEAGEGART